MNTGMCIYLHTKIKNVLMTSIIIVAYSYSLIPFERLFVHQSTHAGNLLINLLMLALATSLNRCQSHSGGFTGISSPLHTEQELIEVYYNYALPLTPHR